MKRNLTMQRVVRWTTMALVGAAVSSLTTWVRRETIRSLKHKRRDHRLDHALIDSMDCSDAVAKY